MDNVIRIDFQLREVAADGKLLPPEESRYITFGDYVLPGAIKDFFERCALAVDSIYSAQRAARALVIRGVTNDKIYAIKLLRTFTHCGFKEAKDLIEAPVGTRIIVFRDGRAAKEPLRQFTLNSPDFVVDEAADFDKAVEDGVFPFFGDVAGVL